MDFLPQSITELISEFSHLPGIGQKTAERLTFYLLRPHRSLHQDLARALLGLKDNLHFCETCHNLSSEAICKICSDVYRDKTTICVVEEALDAVALEKTHEYHGVYHVLHGALSPLDGIGPNDLTIHALKNRIEKADPKISEVILATNPTLEGDSTAMYIQKLLQPLGVKMTRIACGLPTGGNMEYADNMTLKNSLLGRRGM